MMDLPYGTIFFRLVAPHTFYHRGLIVCRVVGVGFSRRQVWAAIR